MRKGDKVILAGVGFLFGVFFSFLFLPQIFPESFYYTLTEIPFSNNGLPEIELTYYDEYYDEFADYTSNSTQTSQLSYDDLMFVEDCGKYKELITDIAFSNNGMYRDIRSSFAAYSENDCESFIKNNWAYCYSDSFGGLWVC